jgi:pentatricopeptide repeat protein
MSFRQYLKESEIRTMRPVRDDSFDLMINETLCIQSLVLEDSDEVLVVEVDDVAMGILESLGFLEESELVDPSKPFALSNPKIITVGDDPQGIADFAVVGQKNILGIYPFRANHWNNEQYHARNKGFMMKYVGSDPEKAKAAEWPGEVPRLSHNVAGKKLEAVEMEDLLKRRADMDKDDRAFQSKKKHQRKEISELLKLAGISEDEYTDQEADGIDLRKSDLNTMIDAYAEEQDEDKAEKILDAIRTRFGEEAASHAEVHHGNPSQTLPSEVPAGPLGEAEYQGHSVQLGKPSSGDVKKFKVYVKDPSTGNVKKVNFGDKNMEIKRDNPERRKNFRARHNCSDKKDRTKAGYWSCRMWSTKPVSKIV